VSISRARPPEAAASIEGEVPFHDVDPLHIVWHGHYYKYMEIARTALFRRHAIDGLDLIRLGYRFVIAHCECRHVSPLRYGDRYAVRAWFLDIDQRVNIAYEVWNLTAGKRAARGRTALVTTDAEGEMLLETPKVIRDRIASHPAASEERG
jgi:acyl-CoA thioester hydrolase